MANPTGFMEHKRKTAKYRSIKSRIKDYKDVVKYLSNKDIKIQASRCMDCGIPFCHAMGCPIFNLIPEWNDFVYRGMWKEAVERLLKTNPLPEITGRICPAPCETACTLSINDEPVTIKQIELAIAEYGFEHNIIKAVKPVKESLKKIAVIGSGPAGLAAAQILRMQGHTVTVYEKSDRIGGLLRYGIPDFKLEKWVLDRRIKLMKRSGIKFETKINVGKDLTVRALKKNNDIILLAMGAGQPRDLDIKGRDLAGIYFAMEYLENSNKFVAGRSKQKISAKNKNVLVIGGGDTGSDCIGTARRQGAKKIYQFEIMPKPQDWNESWNPSWPDWPLILRTSSSQTEGVSRDWSINTKEFLGHEKLEEIKFSRVQWKTDEKGKKELVEIAKSDFSLKIDMVLIAMGFVHVEHGKLVKKLKLQLDDRGNIWTNDEYKSSDPNIYVAGDASTGASLIVRALYNGQQAAYKIDDKLSCKP